VKLLTAIALVFWSLTCIACQGGGSTPNPEPAKSNILAVSSASILRVYCAQSSADPGTKAQVISPYFGQATVDENGGFTINIDLPQTTARPSQVAGEVNLNYTVNGVVQLAKVPVTRLSSQVTTPLFTTGAGPNDMVFGNDSLYVANSLDNTVVRYGLDGGVLGTITYEEGASPSYLALHGNNLYISANGENTLNAFEADTFHWANDPGVAATYGDEELAFLGPGQPIANDRYVWLPLASIVSFNPTVYEESPFVELVDFYLFGAHGGYALEYGLNPQFGIFDFTRGWLLIVATGDIQFDENWQPFAASNSFIEARSFSDELDAVYPEYPNIDLGPVGAGRIALHETSGIAFLGNSLNGHLYKVNTVSGDILRGADNPIVLTTEFTFISDVAYSPDGKYVLAASFNTDELYVIDAATDEVNPGPYPAPFDLSLDPELLAGCANVEIDPTPRADGGYDAYVLYGVANAVAKVELF